MFKSIKSKSKIEHADEHTFAILKKNLDQNDKGFLEIMDMNEGEYLLSLLAERPERFDLSEKIEVNLHEEKIPKGMQGSKEIGEFFFNRRYLIEFNLSMKHLKEIVSNNTSIWHGKELSNSAKVKLACSVLKKNLVGVFVDVYNDQTKMWDRFKKLEIKRSCKIM